MINPAQIIRDFRNERTIPFEVAMPAEKPLRSVVGGVVVRMHGMYLTLSERREILNTEIARMTEELRQTNLSLETLSAGLMAVGDDPALTEDEREMVGRPIVAEIEDLHI